MKKNREIEFVKKLPYILAEKQKLEITNAIYYRLRHPSTLFHGKIFKIRKKKFFRFFGPRGWFRGGQGVVIWGG